jgi:D-xylose reductase
MYIKTMNFTRFSKKFFSTKTKSIDFTITLNNGMKMPRVGLGTYEVKDLSNIVHSSIKDGVRLIDTAWFYKNEKQVGEGIKKAIGDGLVKREDLFIITKVWPSHKHKVEESMKESLTNLGLDYVDLYLDHWPIPVYNDPKTGVDTKPIPLHEFWPVMESLVEKGLTRSLGASNYHVQILADLLSYAKIKPVVNEFELHPYLTERELVKYCNTQQVYPIAYNSICRGAYINLNNISQSLNLLEDPVFKKYADKYGVTTGVLALNWALSQNALVIPATSNPKRMKENLTTLNLRMSQEDLDELHKQLNKNYRFNECKTYDWTKGVDYFA